MTSLKLTSWQLTKLFAFPSRQKWAEDLQSVIVILLPPMMSARVCDQWRRSVPMRSLLWQPRPSITTPAFSAVTHHSYTPVTCHVSPPCPDHRIGNLTIRGFVVNQLEKLEAAKADWLVCLSLLSLTASFLVHPGPSGLIFSDLPAPYLSLLGLT